MGVPIISAVWRWVSGGRKRTTKVTPLTLPTTKKLLWEETVRSMRLDEQNRVILQCDWCGEYNDNAPQEGIEDGAKRLRRRCLDRDGCRGRATVRKKYSWPNTTH
jgi:hypothetical protein